MSLVPIILEDNGRGQERSMDIWSRLLVDRIVFIGSEIHDQMANIIIAQLLFLKMEDPNKHIDIYINSPGGSITAGLAIYDTIKFLNCDVRTYCIGQAASMAAILLSAGTKGKRFALPNSRMMIHQPSGGVMGTSKDIELQARELTGHKQKLASILSELTGKEASQINRDFDRDFWLSPDQAVDYGLVDQVVTVKTDSLETVNH
ncbi:ATP-dependent Clp protease proteolytic subunit [Chlamydiia bacterium]|nr:ATP-dependent Clp protease proteolytic subunit [Chlamydiia bacterium]